jgi:TldD protein
MRTLAALGLDEATRAGADYADVRGMTLDTESVAVRGPEIEGVDRGTSRGIGVRVLAEGAWGFAATSRLDREAVLETARRAVAIARASATVRREPIALAPVDVQQGTWATPHARDPFDVGVEDKIGYLLAATGAAAATPGLTYARATCDARKSETWLLSSEGAAIHQTVLQVSGGLACVAVGEHEVQTRSYPNSFGGYAGTGGWEDIVALDLEAHAPRCAEEAVALLTAPELPGHVGTAVIGGSQLGLQVHESVGHALEFDRILGHEADFAGTSFVAPGDIGRLRYGSDLVGFTLDTTTPKGLGTFGYDDEGTPAGRHPLVVEGRLVDVLTNRETAPLLGPGRQSNGTMRAESWGAVPLVRMTNIHLEPDVGTLDELLSDTGSGVLMDTNRSWSIDDRRLNFQFGCEIAWEIRKGRRGRMLRNPTYTGRTPDFWGACDAIAGPDEWKVYGTPNCGKGQPMQVARVAHGAAPARFRDLRMGVR